MHGKSIRIFPALLVLSLLLILGSAPTRADEGMWLIHRLEKCPFDNWRNRGLELELEDIYNPRGKDISDAVVRLGGGTGAFVSMDGLIITNHHVAFGALQRQSSVKINYIEDGFLARTRDEEIPALGYEAWVLQGVEDVTDKIRGAVREGMSDLERYKAIEKVEKKIVKKAEKKKDVKAEVATLYGGLKYYLYKYFKIKDIRIVYAPPRAIGEYGGEVDNWMWPRHTGDFSLLRAYVDSRGRSTEYSPDNVPYHPQNYLAISTAPLRENDVTLVVGYPGRTMRYRTSYSIDFMVNEYYPAAIERYEKLIAILEDESAKSKEAAIRLASIVKGLSNGYKNNQGMLKGLKKAGLLEKKRREEAILRKYVEAHPQLKDEYGNILDEIKDRYQDYRRYWRKSSILRWMSYVSPPLRSAYTVYKWSVEREKKDIEREPGFMDRDKESVKRRLRFADLGYYEPADRRVLRYFLIEAAALPAGERIEEIDAVIGDKKGAELDEAIESFLDKLYSGTKVTDKEQRMKMFGMKKNKLLALGDPFIAFAARLEKELREIKDRSDAFDGAMKKLRPKLMELRMKVKGALVYPDANRTMRLSVGEVKGYSPRDAVWYDYLTTLTGVVEKHTGKEPFNAPAKLIELQHSGDFDSYQDPDKADVPVCFLSTNDVTGGNSGSPILNGKGELIGLVFDGNYESISADYQFIPRLTRTINVDSRYILFILDKFAGADNILRELKIH